ncbi:MAG: chorismate-binding protein, partial [Nanoarchaeota archaeon]
LDILREIAFKFKPASKPFSPYCGLFGTISNDFIAGNENLLVNEDKLNDPDYILYFLDNMFIVDHKERKTYFVANALVTDNKKEEAYRECSRKIINYEKTALKKAPKPKKYKKKNIEISYDTSNEEFLALMRKLENDISNGNILYASPSRLVTANCNAEPLDIYSRLKDNNSGSTLCFINDNNGITISSGAESFLSAHDGTVEFRIYTSRIQRAISKDQTDNDNKHEALLKTKEDEIFFNLMLLDDARNSVARVSEKGTRFVEKMFEVNKLPRYQYLSSTVKGALKESLDALHALSATANSSGIPRLKAMQLISKVEKAKSMLNSCSLVCLSPDKELYGMQIGPMRIKKSLAYIRAASRVFNGSDDEKELAASDERASRFLDAIRLAGGVK